MGGGGKGRRGRKEVRRRGGREEQRRERRTKDKGSKFLHESIHTNRISIQLEIRTCAQTCVHEQTHTYIQTHNKP